MAFVLLAVASAVSAASVASGMGRMVIVQGARFALVHQAGSSSVGIAAAGKQGS